MRKLKELENLIHIRRYPGNSLIKQESVSDHVWCMISLAIEYVPHLNSDVELFNFREVIYAIAIHDIDEAFYCDIPRKFKYHNPTLRSEISKAVDDILQKNLTAEIIDDLHVVEDRNSPIGALVKIFDIAQAGFKMVSEINLGNSYFEDELCNVFDSLEGMRLKITNWGSELELPKNALLKLIEELVTSIKSERKK